MRSVLLYLLVGAALLVALPAPGRAQEAPTAQESSTQRPDAPAGQEVPTQGPAVNGIPPRRTDIQTRRRDKGVPHDEWPGSFAVPGLGTRAKIGGFVEFDAIGDSGPMASRGQFVTSTIVTGNATSAQGAGGQASVSVSPSRLYLETRTPLDEYHLTTHVSVDLYRDGLGTQPELRFRRAYVEVTNLFLGGDVLVGQDWSTCTDLEAFPDVLDFQGPNSFLGAREPLVRWTRKVNDELKVMVAAETPRDPRQAKALGAVPDLSPASGSAICGSATWRGNGVVRETLSLQRRVGLESAWALLAVIRTQREDIATRTPPTTK